MKKKTIITTVSDTTIVDNQNIFQNKIGDIKMNKFTKTMFAASAAAFITISTNGYSHTEGEGIGGRARDVNQEKYKTNKMEDRNVMTDSMESKVGQVSRPAKSTNSYRFAKGEGIGGRAWVVDQAKYNAIKVEDSKRITDNMRDKAERI